MDIFDSEYFKSKYLVNNLDTVFIPIEKIYPNPNQPRKIFDEERIRSLSESIKKYGLIQPIAIVDDMSGRYMIIAGERRYRASVLAGLKEMPAIIIHSDMQGIDEMSLIENVQREDLNIIEEAMAYKGIIDKYDKTQKEVSDIVGKSRSYIANTMRLLNLPDFCKQKLESGEISGGHGLAILQLDDEDIQNMFASKIIDTGMSVREAEKFSKYIKEANKEKKKKDKDIFVKDLEERLGDFLDAKVSIQLHSKKGSLTIDFLDEEDLNRIAEEIIGGKL